VSTFAEQGQIRDDHARGVLSDTTRENLGTYLERWLTNVQKPRLAESTHILQDGLRRNHVEPYPVARVRLDRLAPDHFDQLLADLERKGVGARVRQQVHALLRRALRDAVRRRTLTVNPLDAVYVPRAPRGKINPLTSRQVRKILKAARADRYEALFILGLTTGARQGELFGLLWGDVDLERGTIQIRRSQREVAGRIELVEPKTAKSRRRIALGANATLALRRHRERLGAIPHPKARVFTARDGGPIRRSNFLRRDWAALLKRAKVAPISWKDATRHTMATLALAENVHPKLVQERLGHSRISTTLDIYSHAIPDLQEEAAATLDRFLDP
jgi:integrase